MATDHLSITIRSDDTADLDRYWQFLHTHYQYQVLERLDQNTILVKAKPGEFVGIVNKKTGEKRYGNSQPGELMNTGDWKWFEETDTLPLTDKDPVTGREDLFNDLDHYKRMYYGMTPYNCENCGKPLGQSDRIGCGICRRRHCSTEYCGESEETARELGVPEGYHIGSDEELDMLMS